MSPVVFSGRGQGEDTALAAVVCHTPLSNLGHCRKGSTLSFSVAFQILKPGLYEVRNQKHKQLQNGSPVTTSPLLALSLCS